jgi:hypothetical protein
VIRPVPAQLARLLLGLALVATPAVTQEPEAPVPRLDGVLRVGGAPADTGTVVLHRVTPEAAGPADSVRVGPGGAFAFTPEPPPGVDGAMYFATYRHEGVLFFAPPVAEFEAYLALEGPWAIDAWPSRPLPPEGGSFRVTYRNIFIEEGPLGWRVTDVFEVGHEDPWSWTSPDPGAGVPVWSHPLPPSALNVQAAETEADLASLRLDRGALELLAPFPPGDRLFVVRYDLPSLEATFPLVGMNRVVELLVREPAPAFWVEGLRADAPVELEEGTEYRRWWAEGVRDIAPRIQLGEPAAGIHPAWWAVGLALLLVAVGSALFAGPARSGAPVGPPLPAGTPGRTRHQIKVEIAHLDEALARGELDPDEGAERRRRLVAELDAP